MTLPCRFCISHMMDLIWTPLTLILYYRPPAKKQHPSLASANHCPHCISGILPNWECNFPSTQPISALRCLESLCKSYILVYTMLLLINISYLDTKSLTRNQVSTPLICCGNYVLTLNSHYLQPLWWP